MSIFYVSSTVGVTGSTGNAGTTADPMGLQEALSAATAGDEIRVMNDGTYNTVTSTLIPVSGSDTSPIIVTGATDLGVVDGTKAIITTSTTNNVILFQPPSAVNYLHFKNLDLTSTNRAIFDRFGNSLFEDIEGETTGPSGSFIQSYGSGNIIRRCSLSTRNNFPVFLSGGFGQSITVFDSVGYGLASFIGISTTARRGVNLIRCVSINSNSHGFNVDIGGAEGINLTNCVSINAGGSGFHCKLSGDGGQTIFDKCISIGSSNDGFRIENVARPGTIIFESCIAINSGGYGFNNLSANKSSREVNNCYAFNNTSGLQNGDLVGTVSLLSADPFVDLSNKNLLLANNAGGDELRDLNIPVAMEEVSDIYPFRHLLETLGSGTPGSSIYFG